MKRLFLIIAALFFATTAWAQSPEKTIPFGVYNVNNASSTIAVTNTFQSVFPQSPQNTGRTGCLIQNNSTSNAMYVFFGAIASATTAKSIKLAAGGTISCNIGGIVYKDQVSITGTATDVFYASEQ